MPAISFREDAYETAAAFFTLLGRRPQDAHIVPGVGYIVRIVPHNGQPFEAEVVGVTEVERDGDTYDAIEVSVAQRQERRVLAIYGDIEQVEVL